MLVFSQYQVVSCCINGNMLNVVIQENDTKVEWRKV